MMIRRSILLAVVTLWATSASAYKVWLGTHKWEGAAADNLDQWDMAIDKIEGINYVLLDSRPDRPAGEGANPSDWNTMIGEIDQSIPGMAEIARSQYLPAKNVSLASRMQNEFATVENRGGEIDIIMLYDEERDGTVYKFNLQDVQDVRDWLDNNGESHVTLCFNLRNNDQERLALAQQPIIDGVMIEASATRWVEDRFNVHTLLQDLWTDPSTSNKNIYFQIPRSETPGTLAQRDGIPSSPINQYVETRRALQVIKNLMGDAFMQSDQCIFIVCNYGDTYPTYPETANNDTEYVNSKSGLALSLIEQRDIFEGRVGVVNEALCVSYERTGAVDPAPTSGMVAHWPLDEGSGTVAADVSGYGFDGELLNGVTWGSDAERGTYAVFDGTDDRIQTTFSYALADTNDFTWAWWAKKEPASHPGSIMVGNRYGNTGSQTYEFIKMTPTKGAFANTDSTGSIEDYDYADIASSSWNHYAMVKSGTSYQWYVNGVAAGAPVTILYNETSALPFLIGGDDDGSGTKVNEHFEGCIDDVVLYREALTPEEVVEVINGDYPYPPPVYELITGWDRWDSSTAPTATVLASNVTASAAVTAEQQSWNITDERGASQDGDWGTFTGPPPASTVTNVDNENLTLNNAATGGAITVTVMNGGPDNVELGSLHFDAYAFRPKAPRTYALSVLVGSGISTGIVFTSSSSAITEVGGTWDNGAHDDIDIDLTGLADNLLAPGESAQLRLAFSGGAGDGSGGHHLFVDNLGLSGVFTEYVAPPVIELIAGWDTWGSTTVPDASFAAANVTASATASAVGGTANWSNSDSGTDPGRGSSDDTTWGTDDGGGNPASAVTDVGPANFTLTNAKTDGEITFTITNNGSGDIELDQFHFDAVAFRSKAARTYALNVLAGSDITVGNVVTSPADAITQLGGTLSGHDQHDDIDVDLSGLADHTLEAGGTAIIQLAFTGGAGDGSGGHHLFVDNVGMTGAFLPVSEPPALDVSVNGGSVEFSWSEASYKLQSATNDLESAVWFDVPGGASSPVSVTPSHPLTFYRLAPQ